MKATYALLLLIGALVFTLCALSISADNATADTHIWDGGGADNLASTAGNWVGDAVPVSGDLQFDGTSTKFCTFDLTSEFEALNVNTGYTGTITIGSAMHFNSILQHSGFIAGSASYYFYIGAQFIQDGTAQFSNGNSKIFFEGADCIYTTKANGGYGVNTINVTGNLLVTTTSTGNNAYFRHLNNQGNISLATGSVFVWKCDAIDYVFINNGTIFGPGTLKMHVRAAYSIPTWGVLNSNLAIVRDATASTNYAVTMTGDWVIGGSLSINSENTVATITVDANDNDLTSGPIVIGIRGVLICGAGTITSEGLDTSAGTITIETSDWSFTNNSLIKMGTGGELNGVAVNGYSLRLGSDVIMNSLTFQSLTASHPYGLYINGTRTGSVTTTSSGTYSIGSGVFAWDNVTLLITPVISIDYWERTDGGFRNTVWQGYEYWADHDSDVIVTWSLTTDADWLSIDQLGNITGVPEEDGTYHYTITATHDNGEVATVSGHVVVETSAIQAASSSVGALAGALVLVVIISTVIMMVQRMRPQ